MLRKVNSLPRLRFIWHLLGPYPEAAQPGQWTNARGGIFPSNDTETIPIECLTTRINRVMIVKLHCSAGRKRDVIPGRIVALSNPRNGPEAESEQRMYSFDLLYGSLERMREEDIVLCSDMLEVHR